MTNHTLETMQFGRVLSLDEAIQSFDEKEESCLYKLRVKTQDSTGNLTGEQNASEKVIRLRKQIIEVDGE